ncbi:MAG: hypothetical protein HPY66_0045 [Firmicutes bacterium]|nr:hypothetical protein [Bacillota bacterium]
MCPLDLIIFLKREKITLYYLLSGGLFMDYQERRLKIFQELTRLAYRNRLKEEIDSIPL